MIRVKNKGDDKILYRTYRITVGKDSAYVHTIQTCLALHQDVLGGGQQRNNHTLDAGAGEQTHATLRIEGRGNRADREDTGHQARWR